MASEKKVQSATVLTMLSTADFDHHSSLYSEDATLMYRIRHFFGQHVATLEGLEGMRRGDWAIVTAVIRKELRKDDFKISQNTLATWQQMVSDLEEKKVQVPGPRALVIRMDESRVNVHQAWELNGIVPIGFGKFQFVCKIRADDFVREQASKAIRYLTQFEEKAA